MAKHVTEEYLDVRLEEFENRVSTKLDGMATILQRLDQERIFTVEWIRRIEADVSTMKQHLKLV